MKLFNSIKIIMVLFSDTYCTELNLNGYEQNKEENVFLSRDDQVSRIDLNINNNHEMYVNYMQCQSEEVIQTMPYGEDDIEMVERGQGSGSNGAEAPSVIDSYISYISEELDFSKKPAFRGNEVLSTELFQIKSLPTTNSHLKCDKWTCTHDVQFQNGTIVKSIECLNGKEVLDKILMAVNENRGPKGDKDIEDLMEYLFYYDEAKDIINRERLHEFIVYDLDRVMNLESFKKCGFFKQQKELYMKFIRYLRQTPGISSTCRNYINSVLVNMVFDNQSEILFQENLKKMSGRNDRLVMFGLYMIIRRIVTLDWINLRFQQRIENSHAWANLNKYAPSDLRIITNFRDIICNKLSFVSAFVNFIERNKGFFLHIIYPRSLISKNVGIENSLEENNEEFMKFMDNFQRVRQFFFEISVSDFLDAISNEHKELHCKHFFMKILKSQDTPFYSFVRYEMHNKEAYIKREINLLVKKDKIHSIFRNLDDIKECADGILSFVVGIFKVFNAFVKDHEKNKDFFKRFSGISELYLKVSREILQEAYVGASTQVMIVDWLKKVELCNSVDKITDLKG